MVFLLGMCPFAGKAWEFCQKEQKVLLTKPFSRVPPRLFSDQDEWAELARGRWTQADHITLGEGRAVIVLLKALAKMPGAHGSRVLSLMDNIPFSAAMAKGRSPAAGLNYLLRKRSAISLACHLYCVLPWIESRNQPADAASRAHGEFLDNN